MRQRARLVRSYPMPTVGNTRTTNAGNPPPIRGEPTHHLPLTRSAWALFAGTAMEYQQCQHLSTDAEGGIHLAYHYYEAVGEGAPTHGVYQYCASECDKAAKWKSVALGENVSEIQLELTAVVARAFSIG